MVSYQLWSLQKVNLLIALLALDKQEQKYSVQKIKYTYIFTLNLMLKKLHVHIASICMFKQ